MDFLNEVKNYIHCMESNRTNFRTCFLIRFYGISYDPITQDFIIVAEYADMGNLKKNIMNPAEFAYSTIYEYEYDDLSSNEKTICHISQGLNIMHNSDPKNRPTAQQIITTLENHKRGSDETYLADLHRKKYSLLKTMNLTGNHPGTCYTSRFLSFQRVKEHLAKLTLEDSGQNDLSLPTSINDDNIKDFEDKIIALPTLSNTSPS
ncbi:unnamed protein product [Rhizophagus irregularis]|nr:unnamed protein product [Rhizophagus irregularis]